MSEPKDWHSRPSLQNPQLSPRDNVVVKLAAALNLSPYGDNRQMLTEIVEDLRDYVIDHYEWILNQRHD